MLFSRYDDACFFDNNIFLLPAKANGCVAARRFAAACRAAANAYQAASLYYIAARILPLA